MSISIRYTYRACEKKQRKTPPGTERTEGNTDRTTEWAAKLDLSKFGASFTNLHTLNLNETQVNDVSGLATCTNLHSLDLNETQVSDVSGLATCTNLHTLNLRGTQVSDVSALATCTNLHTLNLRGT